MLKKKVLFWYVKYALKVIPQVLKGLRVSPNIKHTHILRYTFDHLVSGPWSLSIPGTHTSFFTLSQSYTQLPYDTFHYTEGLYTLVAPKFLKGFRTNPCTSTDLRAYITCHFSIAGCLLSICISIKNLIQCTLNL